MTNLFYELIKAESGHQVTAEQLKLAEDQNLDYFVLAKNFDFPITREERANRLMKGQIEFEILKYEAAAIAEKFDASGIDYRFLKGLGIAMTYPNPYTRVMGDFDVLVKAEAFDQAAAALREIGYQQLHDDPLSKDIPFVKVGAPGIELHRELFDTSKEFYDDYQDLLNLLWKEESSITINKSKIKVPKPQHHFKFILIHFFNHFKIYGCGVRFLLDVLYFSQVHQIDWQEIEGYFSKGMLKKFIELMENTLIYYFNYYGRLKDPLSEAEIRDVQIAGDFLLYDGIFGKSSEDSYQINRLMKVKRAYHESPLKMLQVTLFPSREILDPQFSYAKKQPILLPLAWMHRLGGFALSRRPLKEKLFFLTKNEEALNYKQTVLKQLGYY